MDILLIVIAGLFLLAGFLGCILPFLPGTPLCYLGLIILHFSSKAEFTMKFFILWGVIVIIVQGLDYFLPVWGTKKFGGSNKCACGSMLGLIVGLFFGHVGIILGPFVGAFIGELLAGKEAQSAIRAAFGTFVAYLLGTVSKLVVAGFLIYYYVQAVI